MSVRRVLEVIAILILLMAPLRMATGGAAVASMHGLEVTMDLGHCDGVDKSQKGPIRPHAHCSMAAPGVPNGGEAVAVAPLATRLAQPLRLEIDVSGLGPEATTPPPRFA